MCSINLRYKKDHLYSQDFKNAKEAGYDGSTVPPIPGEQNIDKFFTELIKTSKKTVFDFLGRNKSGFYNTANQETFYVKITTDKKRWFREVKTYTYNIEMTPKTFVTFVQLYSHYIGDLMKSPEFFALLKKADIDMVRENGKYELKMIPLISNECKWT